MQAVVKKDIKGEDVELLTLAIPALKKGQALIKVHASPINPSDLNFMRGLYGNPALQPTPPLILGFEGAGTVVAVGEDVDPGLVNKHVSFFGDCHLPGFVGCWAQYTIQPADALVVVGNHLDLEAAAMSMVNTKTVMGFWHIISTEGHKAVIQTAAASALGKMLQRLCAAKGVETINIVRGKANLDILHNLGSKYVLDSEAPDFIKSLEGLVAQLNPTVCFEAVGGTLAGTVFTAMPAKGRMYVYGSLASPDIIGIKGTDIRYKDKMLRGFNMVRMFDSLSEGKRKEYMDAIFQDIEAGGKIFGTNVAARFELKDFKEAIQQCGKLASKGKVLFVPK